MAKIILQKHYCILIGIHTMELTWNPETNPQAKLRTRDENTDTDLHDLGFGHGS